MISSRTELVAMAEADWLARLEPKGAVATIINLLSKTNEVLQDMLTVEGNLPTGHQTTVRTGLPSAVWRQLNYGVPKAKSTTATIIDGCGMLEVYSEVDKGLATLNDHGTDFLFSEDIAFLEAMSQQMADTLFYGDTSLHPERFLGLAPRYPSVNPATAQNAANVIDMGGTGSTNTSLWIVVWGPHTVHGIFPKGSKAGFQRQYMGQKTLTDPQGNLYEGYRTHYKWDMGLTVRDWRYVVRLANIDVTTLSGGTPPDLIKALIRGLHRLPTQPMGGAKGAPTMGSTVIYCNRTIRSWLDIQAEAKSNLLLTMGEFAGKPATTFRGVPIRTCDAIVNTEARLV